MEPCKGGTPKSFLSVAALTGLLSAAASYPGLTPWAISWRPVGAPEASKIDTTGQAQATMASRRKGVKNVLAQVVNPVLALNT